MADEQAEVSAEIAGRVAATPVERGTRVAAGATLVQVSSTEAGAQLAEAEANAAQSAAALNLGPGGAFDAERVPEVANARAEVQLAESEYGRIKSLLDERVVSRSEYDQRATSVEAARQRYEAARNMATQRYRAYQASLARVTLARKALSDTTVRAPFAGVVVERKVSTGDYVTRGQVVATVVRVDPLRVELAIPEQDVSRITAGQSMAFRVDAFPGRQFTGTVRYISPSLRTDQRAMVVEAVVSNPDAALKPGLFATAEIAERDGRASLLVPRAALREVGSTHRVFVVKGTRLEDRILALGQSVGDRVVVTSGVAKGEVVALPGTTPLAEGTEVEVR
jgi:RND family efflux transporter MFP subunit